MDRTPNHLLYMNEYTQLAMLRPQIDVDDETMERINEYAEENGLRKPRAYATLLKAGLDAEGF